MSHLRLILIALVSTTALLSECRRSIAQEYYSGYEVGPCDSCPSTRRFGSYEPEAYQPVPPPPPPFWGPWGYYGFGPYGYGGGYPWGIGYPGFYGYGYGGFPGRFYGNWGASPWGGYYPPPEAAYPGYSPGALRWYYGQSWFIPSQSYYW